MEDPCIRSIRRSPAPTQQLCRFEEAWDPVRGAAFSLYAALSSLSALGIRYPLKMAPLLLFQLFYKVVWLVAVAVPTWPVLRGATREMAVGALMDVIVIPWPYVFENFVRKGGDRWGRRTRSTSLEGAAALTTS